MRVRRIIAATTLAGVGVLVPASSALAAHPEPTTKADCKNGGFAEYNTDLTSGIQKFKNQGQCIKFVNAANKS